MVFVFVIILLLLVLVASIDVPTGSLGKFERERRKNQGGREVERELAHADVVSIKHIVVALLLSASVALAVAVFGWAIGLIIAVVVALEYGAVARLAFVRGISAKLYARLEPTLLTLSQKHSSILRYIRVFSPESEEISLHSRDELIHVVKEATHHVVNDNEKKLILHGLEFPEKEVRDIMTPRSMIDAVNRSEILGPLVLDDLHKKGHSRIPVIEGDVDHVVGVLHLRDVIGVDSSSKRTAKVETAMEPRVFYITERQSLEHALNAFIRTHHHLFIVVNEYRETVGLLTLEDVIEALLGRKINDEFDAHDDLRAVAARHPRVNTSAEHSTDV